MDPCRGYTGGRGPRAASDPGPGVVAGTPGADGLICIDFDDTLVANQEHFEEAVGQLCADIHRATGMPPAEARALFERADERQRGRHRNRFLLAVLSTYCAATGSACVPLEAVPRLAQIAAWPYDAHPAPLPGVPAALQLLRARHAGPVWLVTTGDPVVQAGRIERSGLGGLFDARHILPEKDAAAFAALGAGHARRVMVGNSPVTDVLPALAAGFEALYVRRTTWSLDLAPLPGDIREVADFPAAVALLLRGGPPAGAAGPP